MIKINYKELDLKYKKTIDNIERKPHFRYIRYLLTKRYSPVVIRKELQKLGLSSPHEDALVAYYLYVLDPVIKHLGLSEIYSNYKGKLLSSKNKKGDFSKSILNYRIDIAPNLDYQVDFCKMVVALEVDSMWTGEIYKFHGSVSNLPVDEAGQRIITNSGLNRQKGSLEKILLFSKRYVIDKLLLENVPISRISKYCRENMKFNIQDADIKAYKLMFFNVRAQTFEEKIEALNNEKDSLAQLLYDLNNGVGIYSDLETGERITLIEKSEKRVKELEENISSLNALYTEAAVRIAEVNELSFQDMFTDIISKAYNRFVLLDKYKDRDVVDPLYKTAKMMSFAHDKVEEIKAINLGKGNGADQHSQSVIIELCDQRMEEINEERKKLVGESIGDPEYGNVSATDIAGLDELTLTFEDKEQAND